MTIPDFQTLMLPVLEYAATTNEHSLREATDHLADQFGLTEEEQNELLPSGVQPLFYNRVGWARTYLKKAGLLVLTRRNYLQITDVGKDVVESKPDKVNMKFLEKFPEYIEFRERKREKKEDEKPITEIEELSPEESLGASYSRIREDLAIDLLDNILRSSPGFFEQ